jgi:hypothetical protein
MLWRFYTIKEEIYEHIRKCNALECLKIMPVTLSVIPHFLALITFHPHFTDQETDSQGVKVTYLHCASPKLGQVGLNSKPRTLLRLCCPCLLPFNSAVNMHGKKEGLPLIMIFSPDFM